nr:hypothetical transcript [Hymenolepis microstoma]
MERSVLMPLTLGVDIVLSSICDPCGCFGAFSTSHFGFLRLHFLSTKYRFSSSQMMGLLIVQYVMAGWLGGWSVGWSFKCLNYASLNPTIWRQVDRTSHINTNVSANPTPNTSNIISLHTFSQHLYCLFKVQLPFSCHFQSSSDIHSMSLYNDYVGIIDAGALFYIICSRHGYSILSCALFEI